MSPLIVGLDSRFWLCFGNGCLGGMVSPPSRRLTHSLGPSILMCMGWGSTRKIVYRYSWNVFVIKCLIALACGKEKGPREPQIGTRPVTLALWGAAWCSECKSDFPAIQAKLNELSEAQRKLISVDLYVPTAANPARPAT